MGICDSANSGKQKIYYKRTNTMPPVPSDLNGSSGNISESNQLSAAFQRLSDKSIFDGKIISLIFAVALYKYQ